MKKQKSALLLEIERRKKELAELRGKVSHQRKIKRLKSHIESDTRKAPLWISGFGDCMNLSKEEGVKLITFLEKEKIGS